MRVDKGEAVDKTGEDDLLALTQEHGQSLNSLWIVGRGKERPT